MAWKDHIATDQCEPDPVKDPDSISQMTPGLTGTYDCKLREEASAHTPPAPPEHMGLQGEYDECGLARRVAEALDRDPTLSHIDSLNLTQRGGTIIFWGQVSDRDTLGQIMEVASLVDGTRSLDVRRVTLVND